MNNSEDPLKNMTERYTLIAKILHWSMAIAFIGMIISGIAMENMENSPQKLQIIKLHKATGILLLGLAIFRVIWRIGHKPPKLPEMVKWQVVSAKASHHIFYVLMLLMPVSGWVLSSAGGYKISFYGLFNMPFIFPKTPKLEAFLHSLHGFLGDVMTVLIIIHIIATIKHHFFRKNDIFKRMWFGK